MTLLAVAVLVVVGVARRMTGGAIDLGLFVALRVVGMTVFAVNLCRVGAADRFELFDHPAVAVAAVPVDQSAHIAGETAGNM
jgi:hypothetical protein